MHTGLRLGAGELAQDDLSFDQTLKNQLFFFGRTKSMGAQLLNQYYFQSTFEVETSVIFGTIDKI